MAKKPLNSNHYSKCETVKFLLALMLKYKCSPLPSRSALTCKQRWKAHSEDNFLTSMHCSRMRTARFGGHCEQNDWQTGVKTLPCPKLRFWATKIMPRLSWFTYFKFWSKKVFINIVNTFNHDADNPTWTIVNMVDMHQRFWFLIIIQMYLL